MLQSFWLFYSIDSGEDGVSPSAGGDGELVVRRGRRSTERLLRQSTVRTKGQSHTGSYRITGSFVHLSTSTMSFEFLPSIVHISRCPPRTSGQWRNYCSSTTAVLQGPAVLGTRPDPTRNLKISALKCELLIGVTLLDHAIWLVRCFFL